MPDTPANGEFLTKILERFEQFDKKFTGEIRSARDQLDEKFTGEIRSVRNDLQKLHNASLETWGHLQRAIEQMEQRAIAREERYHKQWQEFHQAMLGAWENIRRAIEKKDEKLYNHDAALTRLEKEIETLRKDRAAQEAINKDLQHRISKLEAAQNLTN